MKYPLVRLVPVVSMLLIGILIIDSCKKREPDTESQSSVDNSLCEGEFSRIFPVTHGIAVGDSGVQKGGVVLPVPQGGCPDYWIDTADIADGFPVTMWLYYGVDADGDSIFETDCTGNDGKRRKGMIRAVFSNSWNSVGSTVVMQLKNYYVEDIKYEGTVSVTRGQNTFTQTVVNGKCSKSSWTILWNSTRTLTSALGDTLNPNDDLVYITGTASGTDRSGTAFEVNITKPLLRKMGCRWIVSGEHTLSPAGRKTRTIDYGDGTCDDRAIMIIEGNEFEFRLQ